MMDILARIPIAIAWACLIGAGPASTAEALDGEGDIEFLLHPVGHGLVFLKGLDIADLDGDNDLDILVAAVDSNKFAWYEQNGADCAPNPWCDHYLSFEGIRASDIRAAHINGDELLDIVAVATGDFVPGNPTGKVLWFEHTGSGFKEQVVESTLDGPIAISPADFNDDMLTDLVVAYHRGGQVKMFENLGGEPPIFQSVMIDSQGGAFDVTTCDVDSDGDVDVLTVDQGDNRISWYENRLPDAFVRRDVTLDLTGAISITCADVNLDELPDIVAAGRGEETTGDDGRVVWFQNVPGDPPSWIEHLIMEQAGGLISLPKHAIVADIDGDELPDVVSTAAGLDESASRIFWHRQLPGSTPTFEHILVAEYPDVSSARRTAVGDLDSDGDLDIASVSQGPNHAAYWHENLNGSVAIVSAASLHIHDEGGPLQQLFGIDLIHNNGVEPRLLGASRFRFVINRELDPATTRCDNVQIECASGLIPSCLEADLDATGHTLNVSLDGPMTDRDCCKISFPGMTTLDGEPLPDTITVRPLAGDMNFNTAVTGGDALLIKPRLGAIVGDDLFDPRFDFDLNGGISGADYSLIKPRFGNQSQICP